jgi:hypothetical protein
LLQYIISEIYYETRKYIHITDDQDVYSKHEQDQLASVFTDIFNLSLTESVISTCFKQTTIVPVPKEAKPTCLNYYHPVAFTSVAMKCFEKLVMAHINTILPDTLDPQSQSHSTLPFPTWTKGTLM